MLEKLELVGVPVERTHVVRVEIEVVELDDAVLVVSVAVGLVAVV